MTLRTMIVDDEPTAREYLKRMLERTDDVEVVAECADALECVRRISDIAPHAVFLDINMPEMSGVELAKALADLKCPPQLVFVTGYDDFAVPAFDIGAIDYVMKPYNQDRIAKTLARVRARIEERQIKSDKFDESSLGKLAISDREGCKLIDIAGICYVQVHSRKTRIHTVGATYTSNHTLSELEDRLRGYNFFRANESCIVNLARVQEVVHMGPRTYEVLLTEPKNVFVPLSRSRAQKLREMLGF